MEKIIYSKVNEDVKLPVRSTQLAGAWDIYANQVEKLSDKHYRIHTGLKMQPPAGYRIVISTRSSFSTKHWVMTNSPAIGDADYPGEYYFNFLGIPIDFDVNYIDIKELGGNWCGTSDQQVTLHYANFPYIKGDRVAQMWIEKVEDIEWEEGELPNVTDRVGGFGSTGK
jgi:dUTPase